MCAADRYTGRFAPSPSGALHAGSLVAALASWLDARAHQGRWLVRIEDVDTSRCRPGLGALILQQLDRLGLHSDAEPVYQSQRTSLYRNALEQLLRQGQAYACACSRKAIAQAQAGSGTPVARHAELVYPGTCRAGLRGQRARAWRFLTQNYESNSPPAHANRAQAAMITIATAAPESDPCTTPRPGLCWRDRRLGAQQQDVAHAVGDFVLLRADGLFAYQLAVVVDDAAQGITDVVRGQDLADNTARQILLQRTLGLATPRYLHTPLVLGANGEKLSKQNGAPALDLEHPLATLNAAAQVLGLPPHAGPPGAALADWCAAWAQRWCAQG